MAYQNPLLRKKIKNMIQFQRYENYSCSYYYLITNNVSKEINKLSVNIFFNILPQWYVVYDSIIQTVYLNVLESFY